MSRVIQVLNSLTSVRFSCSGSTELLPDLLWVYSTRCITSSTHIHPFAPLTAATSPHPLPITPPFSYSQLFLYTPCSHHPLLPLLIDVLPVNCYTNGLASWSSVWPRKQAVQEMDWRGNENKTGVATKRAKTYEKMTELWNKTKALKEEKMRFMKKKLKEYKEWYTNTLTG